MELIVNCEWPCWIHCEPWFRGGVWEPHEWNFGIWENCKCSYWPSIASIKKVWRHLIINDVIHCVQAEMTLRILHIFIHVCSNIWWISRHLRMSQISYTYQHVGDNLLDTMVCISYVCGEKVLHYKRFYGNNLERKMFSATYLLVKICL